MFVRNTHQHFTFYNAVMSTTNTGLQRAEEAHKKECNIVYTICNIKWVTFEGTLNVLHLPEQ